MSLVLTQLAIPSSASTDACLLVSVHCKGHINCPWWLDKLDTSLLYIHVLLSEGYIRE